MAHCLEIWREAPFGFDIGMANQIPYLRLFTAKFTLFAHFFTLFWMGYTLNEIALLSYSLPNCNHLGRRIANLPEKV